MMKYLQDMQCLPLILEANDMGTVKWHIDGSLEVHNNMKLYSRIYITNGNGEIYAESTKQKLVATKSTEVELIAVDNGINQILLMKYFLVDLGYQMNLSTLYQDNQSIIVHEHNGKVSSTKLAQHINIR